MFYGCRNQGTDFIQVNQSCKKTPPVNNYGGLCIYQHDEEKSTSKVYLEFPSLSYIKVSFLCFSYFPYPARQGGYLI